MGEISDWAELELKKKRLLEELESALAPADKKTVTAQQPLALGRGRIEVIDETALLDSVANNNKQPCSRRRPPKNLTNRRTDHPKPSQPSQPRPRPRPKNSYSRKDLEALRFVNMAQQRNFWKSIHAAFQTSVADEYNTLAPNPLPHNKPILSGVAATNGRWRYMNVFVH